MDYNKGNDTSGALRKLVLGVSFAALFFGIIFIIDGKWFYSIISIAVHIGALYIAQCIAGGRFKLGKQSEEKNQASSTQVNHEADKKRDDRETELWENPLSLDELKIVRNYIIAELSTIRPTNWGEYALAAICTHSPQLSKLMVNGNLDIEFIKQNEKRGIEDALNAIRTVELHGEMSLRHYFHKLFKKIYEDTRYGKGNKFCWYGRDRVIETLRSYRASIRRFTPSDTKFYDVDGEELLFDTSVDNKTINNVKQSLDFFEESAKAQADIEKAKKYYRFKIESTFPVIEFDIEAIVKTGNFKYEGSLVNSLYIELKNLLSVSTDYAYLGYRTTSEKLFDAQAASFAYENGIIVLVKYKGAVSYFPDRVYVELQHIASDTWIVRWLKSYKLHLEGND
jgi:hypothetical protein